MKTTSLNLYDRLEEYRVTQGLTKFELSRKLQIPENYLWRWQRSGITGVYARIVEEFLD